MAVSYTHLTLPTKRIVSISVVVEALKKKKSLKKKKQVIWREQQEKVHNEVKQH